MKINRIIGISMILVVTIAIMSIAISVKIDKLNNDLITAQNELYETKNVLEQIADELDVTTEELNNTTNDLKSANEIIEALKDEKYHIGYAITNTEIDMIAKTVWGEARGCNKLQQSGVVWCILNRVDDGYWGDTVAEVVTKNQFHGYDSNHPIDDDIKVLVKDIIARWRLEKLNCGNVGRTLPSRFLYFASNGEENIFRTSWSGGEKWDWSWGNPYK